MAKPTLFTIGFTQSTTENFFGRLKAAGVRVETGVFQAHMEVELVNEGPVTLVLNSDRTV